jgi:hypothetical protein
MNNLLNILVSFLVVLAIIFSCTTDDVNKSDKVISVDTPLTFRFFSHNEIDTALICYPTVSDVKVLKVPVSEISRDSSGINYMIMFCSAANTNIYVIDKDYNMLIDDTPISKTVLIFGMPYITSDAVKPETLSKEFYEN